MLSFLFIILISKYLGNFPALASAVILAPANTLAPPPHPFLHPSHKDFSQHRAEGGWDSGREIQPMFLPLCLSTDTALWRPCSSRGLAWPAMGPRNRGTAGFITQPSPHSPVTLARLPLSYSCLPVGNFGMFSRALIFVDIPVSSLLSLDP